MINFYEFYILLEGQAEDFVKQNPELQSAYDQGAKNINHLRWLNKNKDQEPLQDIIPLVFAFEKNKIRLPIKDINQYKSPSLLRQEIEKLGSSKGEISRILKSSETTKLGQFGDWLVVMPHTRESSCQWGKGTTWCTAATQSSNLFLNYTARKRENIILYYLIKKGVDSKVDLDSKISIGLVNGKPILDGKNGGLSVNADNTGITEFKLKEILGENYNNIMNVIINHSKSIEGKHPAKKQMEIIAQSKEPRIIDNYLRGMKPDEQEDFINTLFQYNLSNEMIIYLLQNKELSDHNIYNLLDFATNKQEMAKLIIKYKKELSDDNIYYLLDFATNKQEIAELIIKYKKELSDNNIYSLVFNATNKQEMAKLLGQENKNKLSDKNIYYLLNYATNKQEIAEILGQENINKLSDDYISILLSHAKNKQEMADILGQKTYE